MFKGYLSGCLFVGVLVAVFGLYIADSTAQSGVDSYTKLMLHIENNVTDSAAGKTVTNNNATFSSSVYKMGGYSGVFNGSNASAGSGLRPEPMSLFGLCRERSVER